MTPLPHQRPPASELAQGALTEIERVSEKMSAAVAGAGDSADGDELRTAIAALRDRARHLAGNVEKLSEWGGGGAGLHGGGASDTSLALLAHLLVQTQSAAEYLSQRRRDVAAAIDLLTAPEPWPVRLRDREERALFAAVES